MKETVEEFVRAVDDTLRRKKGNVVIPSFAVGRAQDILYLLTDLTRKGRLSGITLYIDSPLAAEATRITMRLPECYDDETREVFAWRDAHPDALKVVLIRNMEESKALNSLRGGAILMAGSGMCDAGRIQHHLKHNLWRKECSVIIVGFQAQGTLGRKIVDGAKRVRVFGEEIAVAADVYTIGGLSAHADRDDLLAWAGKFQVPPGNVFVAHGEESVSLEFAGTLKEKLGWLAQVPSPASRGSCEPPDESSRKRGTFQSGGDTPGSTPGGGKECPPTAGKECPPPCITLCSGYAFAHRRSRGRPAGCHPAGDRSGREARRGDSARPSVHRRVRETGPAGGLSRRRPGPPHPQLLHLPDALPSDVPEPRRHDGAGEGILPCAGLPRRHGEHRPGRDPGDRPREGERDARVDAGRAGSGRTVAVPVRERRIGAPADGERR